MLYNNKIIKFRRGYALYFSNEFCIFSLVPHSNSVRWVEAHSTNKGTEIQNPYVTARGDRAMNLAGGLFMKGGNTAE